MLPELGWTYLFLLTRTLADVSVSAALGWQKEHGAWSQGPFLTVVLDKSHPLSAPLFLPVKIVKEFLFHVVMI